MKKIIIFLLTIISYTSGYAQNKNTASETFDYKEIDGKIIISAIINGVEAEFVLDLNGLNTILPEKASKFNVKAGNQNVENFSMGDNVFGNGITFHIDESRPNLKQLGVDGTIGSSVFRNVVLTIDSKRKKITTSIPYRPPYMKLDYRDNIQITSGSNIVCNVSVDGTKYPVFLDTWTNGMLVFNESDYNKINNKVSEFNFVKNKIENTTIVEDKSLPRSVLGNHIFKEGILSIDFQKQRIYFQPFDMVEVVDEIVNAVKTEIIPGKLNEITKDYFIEHIYDYKKDKEFVFKGDKPVVIDFWATWCGPCMQMMPEMEKMAEKYKDQVIFLKVNADKEKELCNILNVHGLPTLYFIPVGGKPIIEVGALPQKYMEIIDNELLKK